jgi:hypothetical protein
VAQASLLAKRDRPLPEGWLERYERERAAGARVLHSLGELPALLGIE